MASHKALGRGLNALFSNGSSTLVEEVSNDLKQIDVKKIKPNRHQPRQTFDNNTLLELADSIKIHGIQQPLIVTETVVPGEFELVAGERRLRASKLAGLSQVPCMVKKMSNRERFEVALVENIQRQDLNAYEEAVALDGLMKEFSLTQEEAAAAIGKSRSGVANVLRLLKLHENVQSALRAGTITEGHAKCLAGLAEHAEQLRWLDEIANKKLSVRELENLIAQQKNVKKVLAKAFRPDQKTNEVQQVEEALQKLFGRRVSVRSQGKKGSLSFEFYSPEDFDVLLARLGLSIPKL